jgi:hypothetical protein
MAKRPLERYDVSMFCCWSACGISGKNSRFGHDVSQIGTVELVAHLDNTLVVNLTLLLHTLGVDLENLHTANLVGQRDFNLSVQTTGTQQSRIEGVGSVCGHDDLCLSQVIETVELIEEFHQGSLNLSVGRGTFRESAATDGIDFIHEDDTGFVFSGVAEHFADETGGFTDVLVDDGG